MHNRQVYGIYIIFLLAVPATALGKTCPGQNMPNTVKGLYVKYKITDELAIKNEKATGAPSYIRGDELAELIVWKNYRWERLFGRYWSTDEADYWRFMNNHTAKMDHYLQLLLQEGAEASQATMDAIDALHLQLINFRPKSMAFEYDRINVKTPKYSLAYNRSNKTGYGYFGTYMANINNKQLTPGIKTQTDAFIKTNFSRTNQIFGFKKISTRQSKILGIPCKYEVMKTSFSDFQQKYDLIESCTATISGVDVDLYSKMGLPGERHIMEAVDVQKSYTINKKVFCSPSYVTVK